MKLTIQVLDAAQTVKAEAVADDEVFLIYRSAYTPGDEIRVETETSGTHLVVALDEAILPAQVFLAGRSFGLPIPVDDARRAYSPKAFSGNMHRLFVRVARPGETSTVRNLALNPYDGAWNATMFPHSEANVVARNGSAFAARNAIDGEKANDNHGFWPYTSWGINRDPDAALTVWFGRPVLARELVLYLRADFPHDAWWSRADATFSDGQNKTIELAKTGAGQRVVFDETVIEWIRLHNLVKADDPSPFPALAQMELWGRDRP